MLKIYVNDITYHNTNEEHDYILLVDANSDYINKNANSITGCLIKSNSLVGYNNLNLQFFRPLRDDEEILFDLYGNGKVRMVGGKLLIQGPIHGYKDCIVDLKEGEFTQTSISHYLSNNPLTLELSNKGNSGITLYKRNGLNGDILISNDPSRPNYVVASSFLTQLHSTKINGCRITSCGTRNGHKTWDSNLFTKVDEHKIKISHGTEVRGYKILVNRGSNNTKDCIIDMKSGTIEEVDLDEYRKQNPLIIKLKNKIC